MTKIRTPHEMLAANTLVKHLAGSKSYGTNLPTSDTDIRGVFCADSIYARSPWFTVNEISVPEDEDTKFYELVKFMTLLVDQNPNIIETLWVDEDHIMESSPAYDYLREHRHELLSTKVAFTYSGYAMSQLKRIKGHNKWLNNPQPEQPPRQIDYISLVQDFTSEKRFKFTGEDMIQHRTTLMLIPYGNNIFGMYDSSNDHRDLFSDDFTLNTVFEGEVDQQGSPIRIVKYNIEEYKLAKNSHKQYWEWKHNRNEMRSELEQKYGYDCYTDDTEFLTNCGWKLFDHITSQDMLSTFNTETHGIEYHPYIEKFDGKYNGNLYSMSGHHTDVSTTANHKMYIKEFSRTTQSYIGDWKFVEAAYLPESFDTLSCIVPKVNRNKLSSDFNKDILAIVDLKNYLRIMGWYISDGTCSFTDTGTVKAVTIFQSKPQSRLTQNLNRQRNNGNIECIETIHTNTGISQYDEHRWKFSQPISSLLYNDCGYGSHIKRIPNWVFSLTKNEMETLLTCLLQGDDTKKQHQPDTYEYYTTNKLLADDVQRLCFLCGYVTSVLGPYDNVTQFGNATMYHVHINKNPQPTKRRQRSQSMSKVEVTNQRIVCFTVKNHTLVTRKNGKIALHGNCKHTMHLVRLLRMGKEILMEGEVHVLRPDAKELLDIRDGCWEYDELLKYATSLDTEIRDVCYKQSKLQSKVDLNVATRILCDTQDIAWNTGS